MKHIETMMWLIVTLVVSVVGFGGDNNGTLRDIILIYRA